MKIITYNVNGIRAAMRKDFWEWLKVTNADVICLQEIKAMKSQVENEILAFKELGYETYFFSAQKKGYSGVAILTKIKANHIEYGCGIESSDYEGRVIRADYDDFSVISVYMPSGSSGELRQNFKYQWLDEFYEYVQELKKVQPNLIISGDYNICHEAIDIHNPKRNKNTSGFLLEERAWLSKFIDSGFIDTFRYFNTEPHNYTWWSYRANARAKNLGWRIDYQMATKEMEARLKGAVILKEAKHSDHCPMLLEIL